MEGVGDDGLGGPEIGQHGKAAEDRTASAPALRLPDAEDLQALPPGVLFDLPDLLRSGDPVGVGVYDQKRLFFRAFRQGEGLVEQKHGVQVHLRRLPGDALHEIPGVRVPYGDAFKPPEQLPQLRRKAVPLHVLEGRGAAGGGIGDHPFRVRDIAEQLPGEAPFRSGAAAEDLVAADDGAVEGVPLRQGVRGLIFGDLLPVQAVDLLIVAAVQKHLEEEAVHVRPEPSAERALRFLRRQDLPPLFDVDEADLRAALLHLPFE